jgi:tetratricopeptide (TPR) repeat protein
MPDLPLLSRLRCLAAVALAAGVVLLMPAPAVAAVRVMILPFEAPQISPEIESLGPGTMDSLITALKRLPEFIVLDRVTITQAIREQAFQQTGLADTKTAQKLGKLLGAQVMITGRVQVAGGRVRLTGTFVDIQTGVIKQAETVTGDLDHVFDLQDELAQAFVRQQGVAVTAEQWQGATATLKSTASLTAYDAYQRGRAAYLQFSTAGYQTAVDWYRKALAVDGQYPLALTGVAETLTLWAHSRQQSSSETATMLEEARWSAQKALTLQATLPEAYRAMAVVLARCGEPGARAYAQRAVDLAPTDAENWWALWLSGDRHPDAAELRKALELNPRLLTALVDRGAILQSQGRTDDAIYEFRTALAIAPEDAAAHNNLGIALRAKGRIDEAVAEYRAAIRLDGANAAYPYNLAIALKATGDKLGAEAAYRTALHANPRFASAYTGLGVALREQGRIEEAVTAYRSALQLNGRDSVAWFNLGMTLRTLGARDEAIRSLTQFLTLSPQGVAADEARRQIAEMKKGR